MKGWLVGVDSSSGVADMRVWHIKKKQSGKVPNILLNGSQELIPLVLTHKARARLSQGQCVCVCMCVCAHMRVHACVRV